MSWPASSHNMFFQQFFITVRTFNPLTPHHFTIYHFCLTGLDFLARLDWSLWQKLLISYPIFIWHLHYYKLWFCSGWHHAKRNKCSHFWAFFAVQYAHVSQFCPVGTEWQSPGVGSRGCFAFLMKGHSNNWHAPSPLPLSLPWTQPWHLELEQASCSHELTSTRTKGNLLKTVRTQRRKGTGPQRFSGAADF